MDAQDIAFVCIHFDSQLTQLGLIVLSINIFLSQFRL